jgi:hypothetical protein
MLDAAFMQMMARLERLEKQAERRAAADISGGSMCQLIYTASSDVAPGLAMTASTQTDAHGNQPFAVDSANSVVEIEVRGTAHITSATAGAQGGSRILIDNATGYFLGGALVPASGAYINALSGVGVVAITGLSVGSHTVKVQAICSHTATLYCRAATFPNFEGLSITVSERKR